MIALFVAFFIKHFICDFSLQRPYHYLNKGKYGHLGGVSHAAIHGIGTALVLCLINPFAAIIGGLIDMVIHYHVDWAKMNISSRYKLKADNSEWFWYLLGLDQLLHYLTYAGIIAIWG